MLKRKGNEKGRKEEKMTKDIQQEQVNAKIADQKEERQERHKGESGKGERE